MQMVRGLREVHDAGFLHRDIKPGNFVMGTRESGNPRAVVLIDYGLSRRHLRADGTPKPKRQMARWVGSRRYMSLNTHLRKDQGRRDDLYSLLYVLIECLTGTLPWAHLRGLQNLDKVRDMKLQYNNEKLVRGLPDPFLQWLNHIRQLRYEDKPDYDLLHNLLKNLFVGNGGSVATPYDWEADDTDAKKFSCIPGDGVSETEERSKVFAKGYERRGGGEDEDSTSEEETDDDEELPPPPKPSNSGGGGPLARNRSGSDHDHDRRRGRCIIL
jgi:tau tubulin kinase